METKIILATVIIVAIIVASSVFFVNFQKQHYKLVTVPVKTLSLTLNDLPPNYKIAYENEDNLNDNFDYTIAFYSSGVNNNQIIFGIMQLNSTINASKYFEGYENTARNEPNCTIHPLEIGNEGFYITGHGRFSGIIGLELNNTGIINFKISNIVCDIIFIPIGDNYDFIFNLAKIVEQRIYDSLK